MSNVALAFATMFAFLPDEMPECPPVSDCKLFPPAEVVMDGKRFNERYKTYLEGQWKRSSPSRREGLYDAIAECERLWSIYDYAYYSQQKDYSDEQRRQWLWELRELLGDRDYYQGLLPPPVPVWSFRVID